MKLITKFASSLLAMSLASCVPAPAFAADDYHIVIHGLSKHLSNPDPGMAWQEKNPGIGLRKDLSSDVSVQAGFYKNSIFKDTFYASADWTPLHMGQVSAGGFAGLATGYKWKVAPAIGVLARWQGERISITARAFPDDRLKAVFSIEAGWRF